MGQLSPQATAAEPVCLEPELHNQRSHHDEKPTHCQEEQPLRAAFRESLHEAVKTKCNQKQIKFLKRYKSFGVRAQM